MEALLFLVDLGLMIVLALGVIRCERKGAGRSGCLGLFSIKDDATPGATGLSGKRSDA